MSLNRAQIIDTVEPFEANIEPTGSHVDPRPKNHFFGLLVGASGGTLVICRRYSPGTD